MRYRLGDSQPFGRNVASPLATEKAVAQGRAALRGCALRCRPRRSRTALHGVSVQLALEDEVFAGRGVVDVIAPDGSGEAAVVNFVRKHSRVGKGRRAFEGVRWDFHAVTREEMLSIATV